MPLLFVGLMLFAAVHLLPALYPQRRQRLLEILGPHTYRGLFALLVVLIVMGWRTSTSSHLLASAAWLRYPAMVACETLTVAIAAPGFVIAGYLHPWFTGVDIL